MRNAYKILVGKSEGKRPLGNIGVDGRIILDWMLGKWSWTGFTWLRIESVVGFFEHGNEPSGSIKGREFLD
jgi:hypothetical protein